MHNLSWARVSHALIPLQRLKVVFTQQEKRIILMGCNESCINSFEKVEIDVCLWKRLLDRKLYCGVEEYSNFKTVQSYSKEIWRG